MAMAPSPTTIPIFCKNTKTIIWMVANPNAALDTVEIRSLSGEKLRVFKAASYNFHPLFGLEIYLLFGSKPPPIAMRF